MVLEPESEQWLSEAINKARLQRGPKFPPERGEGLVGE